MARHPDVYNTSEWKKVRRVVIVRANGLCEQCKAKGIIKPGKEVDHIIELTDKNKKNWNIAYNLDNLQSFGKDTTEAPTN